MIATTGIAPKRHWQATAYESSRLISVTQFIVRAIVLQMDHLRCKTPERVRNEFYMHLVGYNLIRELMATAAFRAPSVGHGVARS
jgi:hypothetical protein